MRSSHADLLTGEAKQSSRIIDCLCLWPCLCWAEMCGIQVFTVMNLLSQTAGSLWVNCNVKIQALYSLGSLDR